MANAMGMPELNLQFPDMGKTLMSAAAFKNAMVQSELGQFQLDQQRGLLNSMQGIDFENNPEALSHSAMAAMRVNPTAGMQMLGAMATINKTQTEIAKNQAETNKTNLDAVRSDIDLAASNPDAYPALYRKYTARGVIGLPHPSTMVDDQGNLDPTKVIAYANTAKKSLAPYEQQLQGNTPKLETLPTPTGGKQPYSITPGQGVAGIKPFGGEGLDAGQLKARATYLQSLKDQGIEIGKENEAFLTAQKKIETQPAIARVEAQGEQKFVKYIDTANNYTVGEMNANQFNAANKAEPGRYQEMTSEIDKALKARASFSDMKMGIDALRKSLDKMKEPLSAGTLAQLAAVDKETDPASALQRFLQGQAARTLTAEQKDYLTNLQRVQEQSLMLRPLSGQTGTGSESQREAVMKLVPGAAMPVDMNQAKLKKYSEQLEQLEKGVVSLPQPTKQRVYKHPQTGEQRVWDVNQMKWVPKGI